MTSGPAMDRVLAAFARSFNERPELAEMTQGWDRVILLRAHEAGWTRALAVRAGRLSVLDSQETPSSADIVLEAPSDTLAAIFSGELSPTEPYLDGTLLVRGSEADMMKLDVFTIMVWGE
jgi:putative sterol carrier protein